MSQGKEALWGVALGAVIVGATLTVRDALADPETANAVQSRIKSGYARVKRSVQSGCAAVRTRAEHACATIKGKLDEAGESLRAAAEKSPAVRGVTRIVGGLRRSFVPVTPSCEAGDVAVEAASLCEEGAPAEILASSQEACVQEPLTHDEAGEEKGEG